MATSKRRKLRPGEADQILAAYMAGEPLREIARRYRVHTSYPVQIARRRGVLQRRNEAYGAELWKARRKANDRRAAGRQ